MTTYLQRLLFLLSSVWVAGSLLAQDPADPRNPAGTPNPNEPAADKSDKATPKELGKPLAAWPTLAAADRDRAISIVGQFKKDDAALKEAARKDLLAMGASAAPALFQKVSDAEKDLPINDEIYLVFDAMLTTEHRNLMAEQAKKKKLELRKYLLRRLCEMADPELKEAFVPFCKDPDSQTAFYANLGLAALKDKAALLSVLETTRTDWADHCPMVSKVLPAARSNECALVVAEFIAGKPSPVQAAGLRLMRYVATDGERMVVKSYLSAEDHNVKKEAVNALRVMSGQAPLENLSAFDTIGMAKEWLTK
ncbi:MAG: hypothetical protein ABL997_08745 [Planctomycetota bacterium]